MLYVWNAWRLGVTTSSPYLPTKWRMSLRQGCGGRLRTAVRGAELLVTMTKQKDSVQDPAGERCYNTRRTTTTLTPTTRTTTGRAANKKMGGLARLDSLLDECLVSVPYPSDCAIVAHRSAGSPTLSSSLVPFS